MESDGATLFNPSTFQHLAEDDVDKDDEEDQRHIEQQIEERLADMDGEEINLEDDDDDSIMGRNFEHRPHLQPAQNYRQDRPEQFNASPFSFGVGVTAGTPESSSGRVKFDLTDERKFLFQSQDQGTNNLEILYHARGEEIKRLKSELNDIGGSNDSEFRQLRHELALLKGENGRLKANLDHYESVTQGQSDENRELRRELTNLENKLSSSEETKRNVVSQLESSELMVTTLQSQLSDLQKSETILKAKQHHDQVVRSLKERHESETYNMQQENDRLNLKLKHMENELDSARSKCSKLQRDHELLMIEKSDRIKDLQEQIEQMQKRLAQNIAESSSQGYVNIKAMHHKFQEDQEKYATDLLNYQEEIKQMKSNIKRKDDEISSLRRSTSKSKMEQDQILTQKSETISNLQHRLADSEKRLNKLMEETSRNAGAVNVSEKLKQDFRKVAAELEKTHLDIQDREMEIASLSSKLNESTEKYLNLKKKVRQYQLHCKSKETKYSERIVGLEQDYKQKLRSLRDKMEEGYSSKEQQVEKEVIEMKQCFDQELNKLMNFGSDIGPIRILPETGRDRLLDDEDEENLGSRPVVPQPGPVQSRPVSSTSASEELARLFATAKLDLRDQLKMPHERFPLSHMN